MRVLIRSRATDPHPLRVIEVSTIGIDPEENCLWFYTLDEEVYRTLNELPSIAKTEKDLHSLLQVGFVDLTDPCDYGPFILLKEDDTDD